MNDWAIIGGLVATVAVLIIGMLWTLELIVSGKLISKRLFDEDVARRNQKLREFGDLLRKQTEQLEIAHKDVEINQRMLSELLRRSDLK